MLRRALSCSLLISVVLLAACCTAKTSGPGAAGGQPVVTDGPSPVTVDGGSPSTQERVAEPAPSDECIPPEPRACCRAMTEECLACVEQGKAEQAAFEARCPQLQAEPPRLEARKVVGVDCSKRPEPTMCCMAETPECQACRAAADRADKNWQATCGPAGFAPPDLTYDCSKPAPQTPCCRARLPKCTQCVAENRRALEEYQLACPAK